MTALKKYQRIEASGLWRASPQAQRADVIVSIGDATLIITNTQERALAHWSIPAVARANPGQFPAVYHPDGDPDETLELPETERQVIDAIEKLRAAVDRHRPHPGRLRLAVFVMMIAAIALLGSFWLPGAARRHAVAVVPDVKQAEIGEALLVHMRRVTGPPCHAAAGIAALSRLAGRLSAADGPRRLVVVGGGVRGTTVLPGGTILINRGLVEDFEEPDVVAGYIIAERLRALGHDPLADLLQQGGLWASFRLLTTGALKDATLQDYAEHLLTLPPERLKDSALLSGFKAARVRSTPYAYAVDISGETTLGLIEADPFTNAASDPILSDSDWLRLQGICGG